MKIRVFSDIHYEFDMKIKMTQNSSHKFWEPIPLEDDINTTLILAGDLWTGEKSIDQIQEYHKRFERVIVVLGNHDYYSSLFHSLSDTYKEELKFRNMDNVFLMDKDFITLGNDIFVGCTLWTNMDNHSPLCIVNAPSCMYPDFNYILTDYTVDEHYMTRKVKLKQEDWLNRNQQDFNYIKHVVQNNKDKNIHVITHHGCSELSIHERFKNEGYANYYFVNDYYDFIYDNPNIKTWIHGHVHNKFLYNIGECKVIVNPRGYPTSNGMENPEFDEVSLYEV